MKDYMLDPPEEDEHMDEWIEERIDAMMNDEAWLAGVVVDDDDIYQACLMKATEQATQEALRWVMWKGSSENTKHAAQLQGPEDV